MSNSVREPKQQRSIDKKNRIIEAGYQLFSEKGYFSTNTAEIAKKAGVSTGIVYGYFRDKRDILIEVLDIYVNNVFKPIIAMFETVSIPLDFERIIPHVVDETVKTHKNNAAIHEALHSMTYTDEAVKNKFLALEEQMTTDTVQYLIRAGYERSDVAERVHLAIETIQSYAHECVYDNHSYLNYTAMRKAVIEMLVSLFEK